MRSERFEIETRATPEEVWRSLTTAEGIASWFGTRAEIDARLDGERVVGWGEGVEIVGRITDMQPMERLRVVYLADGEEVGAEEWLIQSDETTTRLTLINSLSDEGVDDWEGFYGDMRRGWRRFLASLRHAHRTLPLPPGKSCAGMSMHLDRARRSDRTSSRCWRRMPRSWPEWTRPCRIRPIRFFSRLPIAPSFSTSKGRAKTRCCTYRQPPTTGRNGGAWWNPSSRPWTPS
jgi:uncharacterized protein YndB with AHSA1/START domain